EQKFGRIDILVNVAGGDKVEPFVKSTEDTWEFIIALNYKSVIYTSRAVLDGMIARNHGRIVNIASDAGRVGSKGEAVYSGCKAGVIAFGKTLARELARNNITVNAVSPGPTESAGMKERSVGLEKLVDALKKAIPQGRLGSPEDIAAAVLYFASDEAGYVTGQVLSVNGGLNMV
ncbi:MAG: SDR family oxidoreductase, partial [Dehalococcoidia bacterium]|nr:SDR family oxidoreductase [Dehalococcoidia bacterium]